MKNIYFLISFFLGAMLFANSQLNEVKSLIKDGEFRNATEIIDRLIMSKEIPDKERLELLFQKERMERIRIDFSKTEGDVLKFVRKYLPNASVADLRKWEADGSLEHWIIDGEKKYFNRGASNFFRLNKEAKLAKEKIDGDAKSELTLFRESYAQKVIERVKEENRPFVKPTRMRLNYKLVVDADAVPSGEVIRCWLPFPMEKGERQKDVKLISINNDNYIISPDEYSHRTIYTEQVAIKGKPTEFKLSVEFTGVNEWHKLDEKNIIPYNKNSELYKKYTSERLPHIEFTARVKELSEKIVGDEKNPIKIVRKIFEWIDENIPWAGAREYSTIENISDYCLTNMRGDCGIKTLAFITLARYNGVPARWESGLMIYPVRLNLHDWGEIYFEGLGWVPVDQSFGLIDSDDEDVKWFFLGGNDAYHLIINDDYSQPLFPAKIFPRSETVDFQRGEVEWRGGNLYFDKWDYFFEVDYLKVDN